MKIPTWSIALIGLSSVAAASFAEAQPQGYGMGPGMMGWGYGMGWYWPVLMLIFWVAVIIGIVFLVRWLVASARREQGPSKGESALDILKKRYARGEITKEEFEKIKKDIQ